MTNRETDQVVHIIDQHWNGEFLEKNNKSLNLEYSS